MFFPLCCYPLPPDWLLNKFDLMMQGTRVTAVPERLSHHMPAWDLPFSEYSRERTLRSLCMFQAGRRAYLSDRLEVIWDIGLAQLEPFGPDTGLSVRIFGKRLRMVLPETASVT